MIDTLIEELRPLVAAETARAQVAHGDTYHTPHEAYAVLREEIEELQQETDNIFADTLLKEEDRYGSLWLATREYDPYNPALKSMLKCVYTDTVNTALRAAAEAVQVAAVAAKALLSMDKWE